MLGKHNISANPEPGKETLDIDCPDFEFDKVSSCISSLEHENNTALHKKAFKFVLIS
jgi:hypothetical protein